MGRRKRSEPEELLRGCPDDRSEGFESPLRVRDDEHPEAALPELALTLTGEREFQIVLDLDPPDGPALVPQIDFEECRESSRAGVMSSKYPSGTSRT